MPRFMNLVASRIERLADPNLSVTYWSDKTLADLDAGRYPSPDEVHTFQLSSDPRILVIWSLAAYAKPFVAGENQTPEEWLSSLGFKPALFTSAYWSVGLHAHARIFNSGIAGGASAPGPILTINGHEVTTHVGDERTTVEFRGTLFVVPSEIFRLSSSTTLNGHEVRVKEAGRDWSAVTLAHTEFVIPTALLTPKERA